MEFEPKTIPEGINTSNEHPVREFIILAGGISLLIVLIIYLLTLTSDYLIQYIPIEKENEWFSYELFSEPDDDKDISEPKTPEMIAREKVEVYLLSLANNLKDKNHKQFRFTVNLIEDEAPNAFITPGGHIFVTSGLLKTITSENALSMVIGHEMGHQYYRHPLKSAGRGIIIAMGLIVFSGIDGSDLMQSFIGNTAGLTNLAFSREQEREADAVGVELLIQKYKHASGASAFFKELHTNPEHKTHLPVFMSTHPGIEERIDFLEKFERDYPGKLSPLPAYVIEYINLAMKKQAQPEQKTSNE